MKIKCFNLVLLAAILAFAFWAQQARVGLVEITWNTTVSDLENWAASAFIGEDVKVIFSLDNGNTALSNQAWRISSFLQYRIEGASGWVFSATELLSGGGQFTTDSIGTVLTAPEWFQSLQI